MHRRGILILAFSLTVPGLLFGDTIINKRGSKIEVKVIRILPETVEYKKLSNPDGPVYVVNRCDIAEIVFENGEREVFPEQCRHRYAAVNEFGKYIVSLEVPFGAFGLFNVDNVFTKAKYSFGATPSFTVRLHRNIAAGAECMLLWGQAETDDPLRFIINPNLRGEILFPLRPRLTLGLVTAFGLSIWPRQDTTGVLDSTFFKQRNGWDARAAFGLEWMVSDKLALLCNIGYSANSSESDKVWITHDMMMVNVGVRYLLKTVSFSEDRKKR